MSDFQVVSPAELKGNPFELFGNDWALLTAQRGDQVNTMTISWGFMGVMWGKSVVMVVVRPQRYTKEFIDASDTFSLSFLGNEYRKELAYLGKVSGRDEDKISKSGLTVAHANQTPYFDESKLVVVARKLYKQTMDASFFLDTDSDQKWYPEKDYHIMYIAEIEEILKK